MTKFALSVLSRVFTFVSNGARMRTPSRRAPFHSALTLAASACAFAIAPADIASALYSETTLHDFCKWTNCHDGKTPQFGLIADGAGNLYGTTDFGGKHSQGVVFKYVPSTGKLFVLHNFCTRTNCTDGLQPQGSLIIDTAGNLYGTTTGGGKYSGGVFYKLSHGSNGWTFSVLRHFCPNWDCTDSGGYPYGGLSYAGQQTGAPWDPNTQPAFGVTWDGGTYGNGGVFLACAGRCVVLNQLIHNFKSAIEANPVLVGANSTIYGTTFGGGKYHGGLMYKLVLGGGGWSETVLHNFCNTANCADGQSPSGRLAMDVSGNLFGVTYEGGANPCEGKGCGVAFERSAAGTYNVLYNFCSKTLCGDGAHPRGGIIMDSYNNLFGTTTLGGTVNLGTAYQWRASDQTEHVVYDFCTSTNCADGFDPQGELLLFGGEFYGTAHDGGTHQGGAVFALTP